MFPCGQGIVQVKQHPVQSQNYAIVVVSVRWAGHVARMWGKRSAYRILVGRPEGRRPLGRPRRRWEDNIRMDLQEVGWGHGLD
jgi:hypothetical protein